MTVGERLKELREKLGISQVDFATKINVSKQTLYKYENNIITNIPSDKIEAAAKIGNVSPAYLMGWSDASEKNQNAEANFSKSEISFLKRYRSLDSDGQKHVDIILDWEADRMKNDKKWISEYADRLLNAAHERPDATEKEKAISDAVMEDDNEWK